jgi:hypothetical protein
LRFPDLLHLLHTEQEEVVLASLVSMPLILTLPRQVERLRPALIQWDQQLGTRISCSQRKTCCHHLLLRRRMLRTRHRSSLLALVRFFVPNSKPSIPSRLENPKQQSTCLPDRRPSSFCPKKAFGQPDTIKRFSLLRGHFFQCCVPI